MTLLPRIKYTMTALFTAFSLSSIASSSLHWQNSKQLNTRSQPVIALQLNNKSIFICHAHFHDGVHPGYVQSNHCVITYAGRVYKRPHYQVLVGNSSTASWKNAVAYTYSRSRFSSFNGVFLPGMVKPKKALYSPIISGFENSLPSNQFHLLYSCRAMYGKHIYVGKVVTGRCNIAVNNTEISLPQYQTLYISTQAIKPNTLLNSAWRIKPEPALQKAPKAGIRSIIPLEPGPVIVKPR